MSQQLPCVMSLYESSEQMGTAENKGQDFQTPLSAALIDVVQRIVTTLKPEQVILFGSYAYGQPTPDSDVDLLVIMNTSVPDKERYLAVCRLLRPRPFPVDILVRTPQEIAKALAKGDFFIREITSRGKVLYERNH